MKTFLVVSHETLMQLVFSLPRYRFLNLFKILFLRLNGAKVGSRIDFYPGIWISTGKSLSIGHDVVIAKDVLITTKGGVEIGDRTMIGYKTQIISTNHEIPPIGYPIARSGNIMKPVSIGCDVWIGAGCIILPGVKIGPGAIVAAGSIVSKSLHANGVYAGVPAKLIRFRSFD